MCDNSGMSGKKRTKRQDVPLPKKAKRQYELLGGVSVLTASALIVSIFLLTSLDKILIQTGQYASVVASVLVDLVNTDRTSDSLHGLTVSPVLEAAAQAKANDMAAKGYFAHTSPEGKDPWYWFKLVGYKYSYAGENLAVDFTDSGDVNAAWMNSPTHRDNILNPHYTEIGIATASGYYQGRPTIFVVQEFGMPAPLAPAAVVSDVPANPSTPAVAAVKTAEEPDVLGAAVSAQKSAPLAAVPSQARPIGAITNPPAPAVQPSWWEKAAAMPRFASHIAYYFLVFCVLAVLFLDTGFELKKHHQRKAARAAFLLILIGTFFIAGDWYVFSPPEVPTTGTASVAL